MTQELCWEFRPSMSEEQVCEHRLDVVCRLYNCTVDMATKATTPAGQIRGDWGETVQHFMRVFDGLEVILHSCSHSFPCLPHTPAYHLLSLLTTTTCIPKTYTCTFQMDLSKNTEIYWIAINTPQCYLSYHLQVHCYQNWLCYLFLQPLLDRNYIHNHCTLFKGTFSMSDPRGTWTKFSLKKAMSLWSEGSKVSGQEFLIIVSASNSPGAENTFLQKLVSCQLEKDSFKRERRANSIKSTRKNEYWKQTIEFATK